MYVSMALAVQTDYHFYVRGHLSIVELQSFRFSGFVLLKRLCYGLSFSDFGCLISVVCFAISSFT